VQFNSSNPTGIANSRRQRLTTRSGEVLERAYVFLPAEVWHALRMISDAAGCSNSKSIEMLINNHAKSGYSKDDNGNDAIRSK